jgi:hypothetical protein
MEKETAHRARAGNVEAPTTWDNLATTIGREREKKKKTLG